MDKKEAKKREQQAERDERLKMVILGLFACLKDRPACPRRDKAFAELPIFLAGRQMDEKSYRELAAIWSQELKGLLDDRANYLVVVGLYDPATLSKWFDILQDNFVQAIKHKAGNSYDMETIWAYTKGLLELVRAFMADDWKKVASFRQDLEKLFILLILDLLLLLSEVDFAFVQQECDSLLHKNDYKSWLSSCIKSIIGMSGTRQSFSRKLLLAIQQQATKIFAENKEKEQSYLAIWILREIAYKGFGDLSLQQQLEALQPFCQE